MKLGARLSLVMKNIEECEIICDIGSDHAYIPIMAVKKELCIRAIASDVRLGPCRVAYKNISEFGLQDKIEVRTGCGLEKITERESDSVVIAGMGGILITKILDKDFAKAKRASRLILQPMNSDEYLRRWLYYNGFEIINEEFAVEDRRVYVVIVSRWIGDDCKENKKPESIDYYIGTKAIENNSMYLKEYLEKKLRILEKKIEGLKKSSLGNNKEIEECLQLRKALVYLIYYDEKVD
jgi:tRNA (adenine22-N1)-methyltransferase